MIALYLSDDMMSRVYGDLCQVIELPGLAWLYRYPCICIGGAVVCMVADELCTILRRLTAFGHAFICFCLPGVMQLCCSFSCSRYCIIVIVRVFLTAVQFIT